MQHSVLLTGASGVIGRALLPRLAARSDVRSVFALTRRELTDAWPKTEVLRGDITELQGTDWPQRQKQITAIIHAAADVRFSAPRRELWRTNVVGSDSVLRFAALCPQLSRAVFLSTVHVAGKRQGTIEEHQLEHACGFVNDYEESKYQAELRIRGHMATLPISVIRLSTVIGSSTGDVSRLAAIHHALRFYYHSLAPMIPGTADSPVDLVPLDFAADAILELTLGSFQPGRTFHVCGGRDRLTLAELLDLTMECFLRYRPSWRKRAIEKPAIVDLRTFDLLVRSLEEVGDEGLASSLGVLKYFAPQLAFPKEFDDRLAARILADAGLLRPAVREYFPRIVEKLIDTGWCETNGASAEPTWR